MLHHRLLRFTVSLPLQGFAATPSNEGGLSSQRILSILLWLKKKMHRCGSIHLITMNVYSIASNSGAIIPVLTMPMIINDPFLVYYLCIVLDLELEVIFEGSSR